MTDHTPPGLRLDCYAAPRCLKDPMGEGTHYFTSDDICLHCGRLDMLSLDAKGRAAWEAHHSGESET